METKYTYKCIPSKEFFVRRCTRLIVRYTILRKFGALQGAGNAPSPPYPSGKSYRFIKDAKGGGVYLLRIREIQFVSETTIRISWHCSDNSASTGHGGIVSATKTEKGWELTRVASWDS